jgi:TetR/AcrR family hemagglutinin/protease transcriptional regulator
VPNIQINFEPSADQWHSVGREEAEEYLGFAAISAKCPTIAERTVATGIEKPMYPVKQTKRAAQKRQRMDPVQRRAQLLKCAVVACSLKSVSRAVHADVARLARVSVPTVFAYFPTRRKLVDEVLKEIRRYLLEVVNAAIAKHTDPSEKLFESMWTCTRLAKSDRHYLRVWLDWSTAIQDNVWPRYMKFQEELVELYEQIVKQGQQDGSIDLRLDSSDTARILMGEAHMLVLMMFSGVDEKKVELFLRHVLAAAFKWKTD